MRWIVRTSLRFRFLVIAAAAALIAVGIAQLGNGKVDVFPEFAPVTVEVQTACLGLSASEVESLVTVPLEDGLNGVPRLDVIRSNSVPQLSSVKLLFKPGTNEFEARQLVQERLQQITPTLPTWAAPPLLMPMVSATSRIMHIGLSSKQMSLMDLSLSAYWKIRARLLRVPGVANVAIWGERLKQLQVQVDPRRLRSDRVSLDRVMNVTDSALDSGLLKFSDNFNIGTGGFVENRDRRLMVRNEMPVVTARDLARVPLAHRGGRTLRLGDVGRVLYAPQPLIGEAVVNNGPGLLLVVEKYPGANTLEVTHGVDRALAELRPGMRGIQVDAKIFRQASFIQTALHNLSSAVLLGCIFVVFILIAFLFEWRAALVSLTAIPLSLLAATMVLNARGTTVNTMILAGLAIAVGVVVDDAIIDMENIVRRLRVRRAEGRRTPIFSVVLEASLEVRRAVVYATLIDVVAVAPVIFVGGLSGAFFQPLAISYGLAVLASMVVALTVTPALALALLRGNPPSQHEPRLVTFLKRIYGAVLARVIRTPKVVYGMVAVAVLAGVFVAPRLGEDLFPTFRERDFLMHWITPPGTSINEERRIVTKASRELRQIPGIRSFGSHIGQAFAGEEVVGANFGENWISVDPKADYNKTVARIKALATQHTGLYRDVQTYLRERIDEVLTGSSEGLVIRVFGSDLPTLRRQADRVMAAINDVPGLEDLHQDFSEDVPQAVVHVRLDAARRYGLKPGDIRRDSATLLASEEVGDVFHAGRAYDTHVFSIPRTRRNFQSIRDLPIDTPAGGQVPLRRVADVTLQPTASDIKREQGSRRIDIGAGVSGRDLGSVTADIKSRLAKLDFPLGYHADLLGEAAERQAAQHRLLIYALVAAVAIFLLLQAAFGRWRLGAMLFLTLPMALVGGLLAAWGVLGTISLGALVGFYTVLGIAARNGIMMITHFQHLEREEGEEFGPALVLRGAKERLSPILMTALATGLAIVPLALGADRPGQEIEHPMAIVILGGLLTSTLLNLFVVPALYLRFGGSGPRPRGSGIVARIRKPPAARARTRA